MRMTQLCAYYEISDFHRGRASAIFDHATDDTHYVDRIRSRSQLLAQRLYLFNKFAHSVIRACSSIFAKYGEETMVRRAAVCFDFKEGRASRVHILVSLLLSFYCSNLLSIPTIVQDDVATIVPSPGIIVSSKSAIFNCENCPPTRHIELWTRRCVPVIARR